jgi:hypothetical protein
MSRYTPSDGVVRCCSAWSGSLRGRLSYSLPHMQVDFNFRRAKARLLLASSCSGSAAISGCCRGMDSTTPYSAWQRRAGRQRQRSENSSAFFSGCSVHLASTTRKRAADIYRWSNSKADMAFDPKRKRQNSTRRRIGFLQQRSRLAFRIGILEALNHHPGRNCVLPYRCRQFA